MAAHFHVYIWLHKWLCDKARFPIWLYRFCRGILFYIFSCVTYFYMFIPMFYILSVSAKHIQFMCNEIKWKRILCVHLWNYSLHKSNANTTVFITDLYKLPSIYNSVQFHSTHTWHTHLAQRLGTGTRLHVHLPYGMAQLSGSCLCELISSLKQVTDQSEQSTAKDKSHQTTLLDMDLQLAQAPHLCLCTCACIWLCVWAHAMLHLIV